jgi:hypothetical protein
MSLDIGIETTQPDDLTSIAGHFQAGVNNEVPAPAETQTAFLDKIAEDIADGASQAARDAFQNKVWDEARDQRYKCGEISQDSRNPATESAEAGCETGVNTGRDVISDTIDNIFSR